MLARVIPLNGGLDRSWSSSVPLIERLAARAFSGVGPRFLDEQAIGNSWSEETFAPLADVIETKDNLQVSLDLPGHDPKSVQARLEENNLIIQAVRKPSAPEQGASHLLGERGYGLYARSFVLPSTVDGSKCEARYERGVLTVTLPKREESKARLIDINVS